MPSSHDHQKAATQLRDAASELDHARGLIDEAYMALNPMLRAVIYHHTVEQQRRLAEYSETLRSVANLCPIMELKNAE